MTVTVNIRVRVESPLLKRLLKPKPRIEKLPPFSQQRGDAQPSPFSMWLGSIGVAAGGLALAMFAGSDPDDLRRMGTKAVHGILTPDPVVAEQLPRPPRAFYPYDEPPTRASR